MASNSKKPTKNPSPIVDNPEKPAEGNQDFRAEIAKSREMISSSDKAPAEPVKNKGGRPSNDQKKQQEEAAKAAKLADLNRIAPPVALKAMVGLPFDLAALKTGFEGWKLTDEEAEAIVPSLHSVLLTYAHQVQGESVALFALAGALFSVGLGKYMAFLSAQNQEGSDSAGGAGSTPRTAPPASNPPGVFFPPGVHV